MHTTNITIAIEDTSWLAAVIIYFSSFDLFIVQPKIVETLESAVQNFGRI